eukprot:12106633-Ditylum_brightwellii.AAC.1
MDKKHSNKDDCVANPWEGYKGNLFLVLEYVLHDLMGLLDMAYKVTEGCFVSCLMFYPIPSVT